MHPELVTLPGGFTVKTYGFMMMVGFLSAVWLAMRRARRVKVDPDVVLDLSFLALLFGVGGARIFYVIHYWKTQFADAPNRFLAAIDITRGGLEFLGGFLGAILAILIYCKWKKISVRLYGDIMAPSTMWGLALGRIGCFFNGCCFGGICMGAPADNTASAWAARFPYASPAQWQQWEDREVTVPAELITTGPGALQPSLIPESQLLMSVERREGPGRKYYELRDAFETAKTQAPDSDDTRRLQAAALAAGKKAQDHERKIGALRLAQKYPSREKPSRTTSVSELEELAERFRSLPVHPTQLYSTIHALLLSALLSALFYVRKRHGVVIGALLVLYPVPRAILEMIRVDNPTDMAGLTVSQSVSIGLLIVGAAYLYILYKHMPERSPILAPHA